MCKSDKIKQGYEGEEKFKGKKIRFMSLWRWLLGM